MLLQVVNVAHQRLRTTQNCHVRLKTTNLDFKPPMARPCCCTGGPGPATTTLACTFNQVPAPCLPGRLPCRPTAKNGKMFKFTALLLALAVCGAAAQGPASVVDAVKATPELSSLLTAVGQVGAPPDAA